MSDFLDDYVGLHETDITASIVESGRLFDVPLRPDLYEFVVIVPQFGDILKSDIDMFSYLVDNALRVVVDDLEVTLRSNDLMFVSETWPLMTQKEWVQLCVSFAFTKDRSSYSGTGYVVFQFNIEHLNKKKFRRIHRAFVDTLLMNESCQIHAYFMMTSNGMNWDVLLSNEGLINQFMMTHNDTMNSDTAAKKAEDMWETVIKTSRRNSVREEKQTKI